jgi:hypothetical protein
MQEDKYTKKRRKNNRKASTSAESGPVCHPDAAGADIHPTSIFIAVPPERNTDVVRKFSTFTRDLMAAVDWLKLCRIRTVAMESTGVYWIPLYQMLSDHGFEVCLVNARHVKNVRSFRGTRKPGPAHLTGPGIREAKYFCVTYPIGQRLS